MAHCFWCEWGICIGGGNGRCIAAGIGRGELSAWLNNLRAIACYGTNYTETSTHGLFREIYIQVTRSFLQHFWSYFTRNDTPNIDSSGDQRFDTNGEKKDHRRSQTHSSSHEKTSWISQDRCSPRHHIKKDINYVKSMIILYIHKNINLQSFGHFTMSKYSL